MTVTYVYMRDTWKICGAGVFDVAAIPEIVVVLGETFVIFSEVCLTLQFFRVDSLAVVFVK